MSRGGEEIGDALDVSVTVARLWYCRARKRFIGAFAAAAEQRWTAAATR